MVHVTAPTSLAVDVPQGRKLFVFDRVFPETVDQDGIWEYLSDSVSSFLQGYNVSILAYGQSGAGKSYTMGTSGPNEQSNADAMGESPDWETSTSTKMDMANLNAIQVSFLALRSSSLTPWTVPQSTTATALLPPRVCEPLKDTP